MERGLVREEEPSVLTSHTLVPPQGFRNTVKRSKDLGAAPDAPQRNLEKQDCKRHTSKEITKPSLIQYGTKGQEKGGYSFPCSGPERPVPYAKGKKIDWTNGGAVKISAQHPIHHQRRRD